MENSISNTAMSDNGRYTINLDASGMDAIVGSLYKNDWGSSSTSFHGEPSTPFGRDNRKERSFHNFEPSSSSSSVRHQKSMRPRRHKDHCRRCTIDHAPTLSDKTNITAISVSEQEGSSPVWRSFTSAAAVVEQEESIIDNNNDDNNDHDGHNDHDSNSNDDDEPMPSCPMPTSSTTAAHSGEPSLSSDRTDGEPPPSSDRKDGEPSRTSDRHKKPTTTTSTTSSHRHHKGPRRRHATVDSDDFAPTIQHHSHQQEQQQQQEQQHAPASSTPLQKEDSKQFRRITNSMSTNINSIHDDHDHNNNNVSSSRPPLVRSSSCKRVSWMSNLHSVSLFDLSKSPDTNMPMNSDKLNHVIRNSLPPLPLVLDKEHKGSKKRTEKHWGRSSADWDEELQSHQQHQHNHTSKQNTKKKKKKTAPPPTPKKQPIIKVISLPWKDHRGVQGEYTGEVNYCIQPHGKGTFCTTENDDSTVVYSASVWKNGKVVSVKIPVDYDSKEVKKTTTASGVTATTTSSSSRRRRSSSSNSFHRRANSTGSARTRGVSCVEPFRRRSYIGLDKTQLPSAGLSAPKPRPAAAAASSSSTDHRPQSSAAGDSSSGDEVKDMTSHVVVQYPPSYLNNNKHIEDHDADDLDPKYSPTMSDQTLTFNATTSTTSLPGYHLGQRAQKRSHMIIVSKKADPKIAIANALSLKSLDFAFVLRSNGDWTYSIVADKPITDDAGMAIRFVLDGKGSTKTIRKKYWGRGIRLINNAKIHSSTHQKKEDKGVEDEHYPISEDESSAIKEIMGRQRKVMEQAKQQSNISEERGRGASGRQSEGHEPILEEASSPSTKRQTMRSQTSTSSQRSNDSEASSSVESMTNRLKVSPQRASKKEATQHPKLATKISKKISKDERRAPKFHSFLGSVNQSMTSVAAVIAPTSPRRANTNQRLQQPRFNDSRRLSMNSGFSDAAVIAPLSLLGELSLDDSKEDNIRGNTMESNFETMMSLDYLGTLDGTLEEKKNQCKEERQRLKPSLYQDLLSSRTGEGSDSSSGEHWESSKPNSNEGGSSFMERDVGSSDNGEFVEGSNSSAHDNSFHQSVHTFNLQGEMEKGRGGIYYHPSSTKQKNSSYSTKKHSSFHIATAHSASEAFPNRRVSTGSTSFHATAVPDKKTRMRSRRRSRRATTSSVGSMGSDLSSFSTLLRDMHSLNNYIKCEEGSQTQKSSSYNWRPMERVRHY